MSIAVANLYRILKLNAGYSDDARLICLKMYVNGMGFRGIERVTGIHHTTVIRW
ncbi:MAG: hypothetical protein F6K60_27020 [Okeania sp. SIO1F9]|nr:hypothetical protein [Okeania sp. SIO1F9]